MFYSCYQLRLSFSSSLIMYLNLFRIFYNLNELKDSWKCSRKWSLCLLKSHHRAPRMVKWFRNLPWSSIVLVAVSVRKTRQSFVPGLPIRKSDWQIWTNKCVAYTFFFRSFCLRLESRNRKNRARAKLMIPCSWQKHWISIDINYYQLIKN